MKERCTALVALFTFLLVTCYGQTFEGTISFRTINDGLDRTLVMQVKEDKTVLEVETDSSEVIRVIKDYGKESTTLLRSRNDLKFGFILPSIQRVEPHPDETKINNEVLTETNDETKIIGPYKCTKYTLKSEFAQAEAWISNEVNFSLSRYFPEFLGSGVDPELLKLRNAADQKGFIISYHEIQPNLGLEKNIEITLASNEIPDAAFDIPEGFTVLDQQGMAQLFTEAQHDVVKKKQWEDFQVLFGKK